MEEEALDALLRERAIELEVAILVVAEDRMAGMCEMDADLVRAPGEELELEQAEVRMDLDGPHPGHGGLPVLADRDAALSLAGDVLMERLPELPSLAFPGAFHDCKVALVHFSFAQHPVQLHKSAALLGDD